MGPQNPTTPPPPLGAFPAVSRLRQWWARRSPLARDIAAVLLLKVVLLWVLWYACFREPVAPHMIMPLERVESRLVGPLHPPESPHAVR